MTTVTLEEALEQMGVDTGSFAEPVGMDARRGSQVEFRIVWFGRTDMWGDHWIVHDGWRDDEIVGAMWVRDGEKGALQTLELGRHWVARACRWPRVHRDYSFFCPDGVC